MRYLVHMGLAFIVITLNSPGTFGAVQSSNPPGPYQQSCKEIEVKGHTLRARCPDSNGKLRPAELKDFEGCRGEITNNDGFLECIGGKTPTGSYTESCGEIRLWGDALRATCQNSTGQWLETSLRDFTHCVGDIVNDEGTLRCSMGTAPPTGPYSQSCRNIYFHGGALHAACKTSGDKWVRTTLDRADRCVGDITNNDGTLRCKIGEVGPPAGPYTKTCRDIRLRGSTLQAACQNGDGQWNETSLRNVRKCDGEIINADGELRCRR